MSRDGPNRFLSTPESSPPLVSPTVRAFLHELGRSRVRDELLDEIAAIGRDPEGRGALVEGELDPEFRGLRFNIGVAGYAIFYVGPPERVRAYITSIELWEFAP